MRIVMMLITIIGSSRVKPREQLRRERRNSLIREVLDTHALFSACGILNVRHPQGLSPSMNLALRGAKAPLFHLHLPIFIFRAVEGCALGLGVDIENALSAPGVGVGIVLHGAHAPFLAVRHRICRDRTEKAVFLASLALDALDQRLEVWGISLTVDLGL